MVEVVVTECFLFVDPVVELSHAGFIYVITYDCFLWLNSESRLGLICKLFLAEKAEFGILGVTVRYGDSNSYREYCW